MNILNINYISKRFLQLGSVLLLTVSSASCSEPQSTVVQAEGNTSITAIHEKNKPAQGADAIGKLASNLSEKEISTLKKNLVKNLKTSGFETEIESVQASGMPDLLWVRAKGLPAFFADKSGQFIIQGDVIKLGGEEPIDVSAPLRQNDAKVALSKVSADDLVTFKPKGDVKSAVYIFTDVDCGYCRKLHAEINDITNQGIEVRYLAWPRAPESILPMESIWCSKDKLEAMTKSKRGESLGKVAACTNPVKQHVELGMQLGVRGTPAIFTLSGEQIGGYLPPKELAEQAIHNQ